MLCPYCGTEVPGTDQFCGECGRRVREVPAAASPAPAPIPSATPAPMQVQPPATQARRGGPPLLLFAAVGVLLLVVIGGGAAWGLGLFSSGGGDGGLPTQPPPGDPVYEDLKSAMKSADEAMIYALSSLDTMFLDMYFTGVQLERVNASVGEYQAKGQSVLSTLDDQRDWSIKILSPERATVEVTEVWSRMVMAEDGTMISQDSGRVVRLKCTFELVESIWKAADCNPK